MKQLVLLLLMIASLSGLAQSVDGPLVTVTATTAATNTYTISYPLPTTYNAKERFIVAFANANTGAATLNRNGLGAKAIKREDGTDVVAGDICACRKLVTYNGTYYQLIGNGTNIKTVNSTSLLGSGDVAVQPTLVSGTNIKTVNSTTLLGSGDLAVQSTLVSGTNIKTVNGSSLLGSGDLTVSGGWALTGTSTLTGAATIAGSSSNTLTFSYPSLGTTPVNGAGLWLRNTTSATNVLNQISPSLVLEGQGWKTNATAGSQSVRIKQDILTATGTASPSGSLRYSSSINGGAYSDFLKISPNLINLTGSGLTQFVGGETLTVTPNAGNTGLYMEDLAGGVAPVIRLDVNSPVFTAVDGTAGLTLNDNGFSVGNFDLHANGSSTISSETGLSIRSTNASSGAIMDMIVGDAAGGTTDVSGFQTTSSIVVLQASETPATSNQTTILQLGYNPGEFSLTDDRTVQTGIQYAADYSSGYTARSLVDKGYVQARALTNTATLDFPSTTSTTVSDLTITVTGASVGDAVYIGVPNGSVTATGTFWGWVSASNTVKIRFSPKATEDPASGTFRATVYKP